MAPRFLLIGIAWDKYSLLVPADKVPSTIAFVRSALDRDAQSFIDAGLEYRFIEYAPGESMDRLANVLEEKEWSGVCM